MKLNLECIRAVLLTIEENTSLNKAIQITKDNFQEFQLLQGFFYDEIKESIYQCYQNKYFTKVSQYEIWNIVIIYGLSPIGYEFVETVRDNTKWGEAKKLLKEKAIPFVLSNAPTTIKGLLSLL